MKFTIALLATLALASTANAANIYAEAEDTVGLPGFSTVTVFVETEGTESFRGIDAEFTGALNQLEAAGMKTPFGNLNAFLAGNEHHDSQFLFTGSETGFLSIGVTEDANSLKGALSGIANLDTPLTSPAAFVRLVIANGSVLGSDIQVSLDSDVGSPEPFSYNGTLDGLLVPEPTSVVLLAMGLIGFAGTRRKS